MAGYDHSTIEAKWQTHWQEKNIFATPEDRTSKKFYVLDMFPYPSGAGLHVGHPKGYVATDVVSRAKRMMGYNVLHVMGWDSFGLPCERQAVKEGVSPRLITSRNTNTFKRQLQMLGLSYDWHRELATSEPDYYQWTQWIFLKLYERGLAYEADVPVNWCPALGTVLANEEVKDGFYIETGDPVERRSMRQWMLKITDYAESLLTGLAGLDWPEGIKEMQRHWIGRSEGAEILFPLVDIDAPDIKIFTTRPDTLFGCTCLVLAPEHELIDQITQDDRRDQVDAYRAATARRSERERATAKADAVKTGVATGAYAINPVTDEPVPVWIADYVLAGYGSGAIFSCPAHDARDHAFAKTFGLPILEVVAGGDTEVAAYTGDGTHINSGFLNGLDTETAKNRAIEWLEENHRGTKQTTYRLRDWLFSRQRYWGEPIPVIHTKDGIKAVPESDLPVLLPDLDDYRPTSEDQPPLSRDQQWLQTSDSEGAPALRETSTMPQWAGSCWYYLRFINPKLKDKPWDKDDESYWMPVDLYVGGAEHATLHLLYARFWHHVLHDLGLVSTREPFQRLFNQGMVYGTSYKDAGGKYYYRNQVEHKEGHWYTKTEGLPVDTRKEKMSKSRYNVVNPEDMCQKYGADALRLYELFMSALEDSGDWETGGVAGCRRFLDRTFRLITESNKITDARVDLPEVERALHLAIKKVTESIHTLKFNVAIADMMIFVNLATKAAQVQKEWLDIFVRILAPFAPHIAEELWQQSGHEQSLFHASFPTFDEAKIQHEIITIAVQINGKLRATAEVQASASEAEIMVIVKDNHNVRRFLKDKTIRKEIYIQGRLVNLVTN